MDYQELVKLHYRDTENPPLSREQKKEILIEFIKWAIKKWGGHFPTLDTALGYCILNRQAVYALLANEDVRAEIEGAIGRKLNYYKGEYVKSSNPSRCFNKGGGGNKSRQAKPELFIESGFIQMFL